MTRRYLSLILISSFAGLLTTTPALAQTSSDPAASPTNAAQTPPPAADDDDAKLRPVEPDFNLINLPTTLPLPVHAGDFHLMHRFAGNLRQGSFGDNLGNLFGIDQGATMSFEYRFGVMKHLEAIAARTNFDKNIQFSAKYDAFHQSDSHLVGASVILSVEGGNNFRRDYSPAIGASISHTFQDVLAVYADPFWVLSHYSASTPPAPPALPDQTTGFLGLGARARLMKDTFFVFEITPRLGGYTPGDAEFAFSIEKRVGGHVFSLVFGNSPDSTYAQLARGGFPQTLGIGFNLARKFF